MTHSPSTDTKLRERVQEYYGKTLSSTADLKTSACCSDDALPRHHRAILGLLHSEILERFYGCGSPIPEVLEGCTVLDLGCGTGRDSYLAAKLAGPTGRVIGVDMTREQLGVAQRHLPEQMRRFGYEASNIDFREGYLEDLQAIGVRTASVDVVISNCVLNLCTDKQRAFREIFRVLKPGGELHFADVFCGRRVPEELQRDPVLYGECLSGALYIEDFRRMLVKLGCPDFRIVSRRQLELNDTELARRAAGLDFYSVTVRAFKLTNLEDRCEDYGQVATYLGTIPELPHAFVLDAQHRFEAHRPARVCGNTAAMLEQTRYRPHFSVVGDRERHFGLFDCGPQPALANADEPGAPCC